MKRQEFYSRQGYPHTLFLTYTFDASFFEADVLPMLRRSGSEAALVIADAAASSGAITSSPYILTELGGSYHVSSFVHRGAFHPKLTLRLGVNGGLAALGSGNLTAGGWGAHRELITTWKIGPGERDRGGWIPHLFQLLVDQSRDPLQRDMLSRMLDYGWLYDVPESTFPFLFNLGGKALSSQLLALFDKEERFSEAIVYSGSSDEDAAFLRWLSENCGTEKGTVLMNRHTCRFNVNALRALPMQIDLRTPKMGRLLHAKFYLLRGEQRDLVLFGSANCSAAAWIVSPATVGNIEAMAVTSCDRGEADTRFAHILELLSDEYSEARSLEELERTPPMEFSTTRGSDLSKPVILSALWRASRMSIDVTFATDQSGRSVSFSIADRAPQVAHSTDGYTWTLQLDAPISKDMFTPLCEVVVSEDGASWRLTHWISDVDHIMKGRRTIQMSSIKVAFSNDDDSSRDRLLDDLETLSRDFLLHSEQRRKRGRLDSSRQVPAVEREDADRASDALSLGDLMVRIESTAITDAEQFESLATRFSLGGVLDFFFRPFEEQDENTHTNSGCEANHPSKPKATTHHRPTTLQRTRLLGLIDDFPRRLVAPAFLEHATSLEIRDGILFYLGVLRKGWEHRWLSGTEVSERVVTFLDLMYHIRFVSGTDLEAGLLEYCLFLRREEPMRREHAIHVLGDGKLWISLATLVYELRSSDLLDPFEAKIFLGNIFAFQEKHQRCSAAQLITLKDSLESTLSSADRILLEGMEAHRTLLSIQEHLANGFSERAETLNVGDFESLQHGAWLWGPRAGWARYKGFSRDGQKLRVRLKKRFVSKAFDDEPIVVVFKRKQRTLVPCMSGEVGTVK